MSAFAAARNTLFTDPNLSRAAIYTPSGGTAVSIRVIYRRPTEEEGLGSIGHRGVRHLADVRASELVAPAKGDAITIADVGGFVVADATVDSQGGVHRLVLRPE